MITGVAKKPTREKPLSPGIRPFLGNESHWPVATLGAVLFLHHPEGWELRPTSDYQLSVLL